MANKQIQRICCVCRVLQPVTQMTRVVRVGNEFVVQTEQRLNGRGCHICPKCLPQAIAKKALNRSFKTPVPESVYKQLATMAQNVKLK